MRPKTLALGVILFGFVMLEVLSHDILLNILHKKFNSWIYLFSGLCIGVIPLLKSNSIARSKISVHRLLFPTAVCIIFLLGTPFVIQLFEIHPIDYTVADMLPIMEIMSERFISGKNPYSIIPEIWNGMQPIYLPAMWFPFILPTIFDFDMRWMTYVFIFLGVISLYYFDSNKSRKTGIELAALLPLGLLIYSIIAVDCRLLVHSEEGIVIGYYLLLGAGLYYRNLLLIALAISLCMMSRYSLAIWAVMFVFYVYYYHTKANALKLALYSIGLSLVLLIVSRGILYLDVFSSLSGEYLNDIQNPDNKFKLLPTIENSLGMAKFFSFGDLALLHKIFFVFLFGVPACCLFIYHKYSSSINKRFFNLCSLKICLVFFYNFLIVPVQYLFYTSTFFSIAILYFYLKDEN